MNDEAVKVLRNALSRGEIVLARSPQAWRQLVPDVIWFSLLFSLGVALLIWRVVLRPNEPEQMKWDFVLAVLFLASGLLVAAKIWWLLRSASSAWVIGINGIGRQGSVTQLVGWAELADVSIMPFLIVAHSAKGNWVSIGAYTTGFEEIKSMFEAIVALGSKSRVARLGSKAQISDAINALYRGAGGSGDGEHSSRDTLR